jgi:KDO2-lipid IV(A) lauroyltransferase
MPDFEITDRYAQLLEEQIREEPELWLWTHNRWKRTKEEWLKHQEKKETNS